MISKLKRPPTEWEKIFASYTSDKRLITRICRKLKKLNSPKINEVIKKLATELKRTFSKEEMQMAKKTYEKMFTIPDHKRNANQNHTKILPHLCWSDYHSEHQQQQMLVRMWEKGTLIHCW
jgi:hypothetical protein